MTDHNLRACVIASTRWPSNWRRTRKAPGFRRSASFGFVFSRISEKELRSRAGTRHHRCYRVALAFPRSQKEHFRAGRVLENVIGARMPVDFKKTGAPRIGPR